MVCDERRMARSSRGGAAIALLAWALAWSIGVVAPAAAQNADDEDHAPPPVSEEPPAQQFEKLLDSAKQMGPWESQASLNNEAIGLVFERQGWTSEPDRFALDLVREVDRIPPWQPQRRQELFLNSLQTRYNLSESQKATLNQRMQFEAMRLTFKYFKDATPIAMEAIRTRAAGEPFTAKQVARWSRTLAPMMDDARQAMEQVANTLSETMTPEQRERMQADLKAFQKRHGDVIRMVGRWQQGQWDPTQWGLDNDPVHVAAVAAVRAERAKHEAQQAFAQMPAAATKPARPEDESSWERYVREYCFVHGFDGAQIKSARVILAEQTARAKNVRAARAAEIARLERALGKASEPERKAELQKELAATLEPVAELFTELCARLDELQTAEQRSAAGDARRTPTH